MKKITMIIAGLMTSLIVLFDSCYNDKEQLLYPSTTICKNTPASFSAEILPLIQSSCDQGSGCHGAGSNNGPGSLTNYNEIMNSAIRIQSSVSAERMPIGGHLSTAQVQLIDCWVANGMLNN